MSLVLARLGSFEVGTGFPVLGVEQADPVRVPAKARTAQLLGTFCLT
jgi:hypothetical protein